MITWIYCIAILSVTVSQDDGPTFPAIQGMSSVMKDALEQFCPEVDICNLNASDSTVRANGLLKIKHWEVVSCCKGCSCHRSCHADLNCCFPDEVASVIGDNSTMECLHIKMGHIDEVDKASVPAYRIVSSAPNEGCKQSPVGGANGIQRLKGSCGPEAVAPWGNLFPVYSAEKNKIYKNELCASCHGVYDAVPWKPYLVCDDIVGANTISFSEHLKSLENGFENSKCFLEFYYSNMTVLQDKRCYTDVLSTCQLQPEVDETVSIPNSSNLTTNEVFDACHSGLNSPVSVGAKVYRNIFCAICNNQPISQLPLCNPSDAHQKGVLQGLSVLLNPVNLDHLYGRDASKNPRAIIPQACLRSDVMPTTMPCRKILCPSGQIRSQDGGCLFPFSRFYPGVCMLFLKLEYISTTNILDMLNHKVLGESAIVESLRKLNPWPPRWHIRTILQQTDVDDIADDRHIVLVMKTETNNPKTLYRDIDTYIDKPWIIILNGSSFELRQSFLEFTDFRVISFEEGTLEPLWKSIASSMSERPDVLNTTTYNTYWRAIYSQSVQMKMRIRLTKTFWCQQISLYEDEYSLLIEDRILISNLTKRILYEAEFELVDNDTGMKTASVCLSDTLFQISEKRDVSAGPGHQVELYLFLSFVTALSVLGAE